MDEVQIIIAIHVASQAGNTDVTEVINLSVGTHPHEMVKCRCAMVAVNTVQVVVIDVIAEAIVSDVIRPCLESHAGEWVNYVQVATDNFIKAGGAAKRR